MEYWLKEKPKAVEWIKKERGRPNGMRQEYLYLLDLPFEIGMQQIEKIAYEVTPPEHGLGTPQMQM
eukprot:12427028-Karenia_brevis.AAC.1